MTYFYMLNFNLVEIYSYQSTCCINIVSQALHKKVLIRIIMEKF
jgi:hypothetical protein